MTKMCPSMDSILIDAKLWSFHQPNISKNMLQNNENLIFF